MIQQQLIAFDQLVNTLVWAEGEGFGKADETISARSWRLRQKNWRWATARRVIDMIFFFQKDHCYQAFWSEVRRKHLPAIYSNDLSSS